MGVARLFQRREDGADVRAKALGGHSQQVVAALPDLGDHLLAGRSLPEANEDRDILERRMAQAFPQMAFSSSPRDSGGCSSAEVCGSGNSVTVAAVW